MEDLATIKLGNYLTLKEFCTCTSTFQKYSDSINPYPQNVEETLPALSKLFENIIDPIIENYGKNNGSLGMMVINKTNQRKRQGVSSANGQN